MPAAAPVAAPAAPKTGTVPNDSIPPAPVEKPVDLGDIDNELDELDDDKPKKPAPKTPPAKPKAEPKTETEKGKKAEPKTKPKEEEDIDADLPKEEEKEGEEPKAKAGEEGEGEGEGEGKAGKPVKAADLRNAYEQTKKRIKEELEPEIQTLRKRVKELESSDTKALTGEMEKIKKRNEELESEMRFVNFQKSKEFSEKYDKPYREAWDRAIQDLNELEIEGEDGQIRKANANDLIALANLPLGEARKQARALFGDAADDVMAHRRTIRELSQAQHKALEEAKNISSEREKELTAQRQVEHQKTLKMWEEENRRLAEKYPKWFAEQEGDTEGNELLRRGFALADLHFLGANNLSAEQLDVLPKALADKIRATGKLDVADRIRLDALIRHRVASHSRLAKQLKVSQERIKELEAEIAAYEESAPPAGKSGSRSGTGTANPLDEAAAELDAIDRKHS